MKLEPGFLPLARAGRERAERRRDEKKEERQQNNSL